MTRMKRLLTATLALMMLLIVMAPSLASANVSDIYRRLEYGDNGQDVIQLQKALKKLGHFNGKTAGNYLDLTVAAVRAYQYANGFKATRYCTTSMQKHIYNASQKKADRTLHYGDSGQDVKELQKALKGLGYFKGDIGGNYLKKTRDAVKAFQKDFGYKQTSYCTVAMQKRIRNPYK